MRKSTLIPEPIYEKFRNSHIYEHFKNCIEKHMWAHYLFHFSFCLLLDNARHGYNAYTPKEWIQHHKTLNRKCRKITI